MMRSKFLLVFATAISLLVTIHAQTFLGSDNFNAAGPTFNGSQWSSSGNLSQTNGRAQLININGAFNVSGSADWLLGPNTSHGFDWIATVTATLDYNGSDGTPSIGIFAKPQEGGFFGIMLRGGQPSGSTDIFSSHGGTGNLGGAHIAGFAGTVADGIFTTGAVTNVILRLGWDSGTGTLSSSYSTNGTQFDSLASNYASSYFGFSPANGISLTLFATSGGVEHAADTMYFDNFSVAAAIPEPSTYAMLAGLGALGLALWRKYAPATL